MKGKKGGERVLFVYWLIIVIIITLGIVSGVLHVLGSKIDVRKAEAGLLRDKLVGCLVDEGVLNSEKYGSLENGNKKGLLDVCGVDLNDKTGRYRNTEQYAIKVGEKEFGNQLFFVTCNQDENQPQCVETTIYVLEKKEEGLKGGFLIIKTAVRKTEENVK